MELQTGIVLKSTETLNGTHFEKAALVITEYNSNGAVGFIFNRLSFRQLNNLQQFERVPFPLFEGGPVDQEHLYFIHRRPDLVEGCTKISPGLYFGGDFPQAIECISDGSATIEDIKIFTGYCGWNAGELEAEIEEGSWEIITGVTVI